MSIVEKGNPLEELLKQAVLSQWVESASAYVGYLDNRLDRTCHAGASHSYPLKKTSGETLYDLASLTKITATTLVCARALARGTISLEETPWSFWPKVSVKQVLEHTSGLPPHRPLFLFCDPLVQHVWKDRQKMFSKLSEVLPEAPRPHTRLYSDLGFLALAEVLGERFKMPFSKLSLETLFQAIGESSFRYFETHQKGFLERRLEVAKTGICPIRHRRLWCEANDPNCFFLGGVGGHAGLFGSISDVAKLGHYFLKAYLDPQNEMEQILRDFVHPRRDLYLGFDRVSGKGSAPSLSPISFGHLGFTGTSLWIDPRFRNGQGAYYVLLTNRLQKTRDSSLILRLRQRFHQIASCL